MAFRAPTFNLPLSLWRAMGAGGAYAAPDGGALVVLSIGRRVMLDNIRPANLNLQSALSVEFLCPKLLDIRADWNSVAADLAECPSGSKRFYRVLHVEDVGKGFGNEYRLALAEYLPLGGTVFGFIAPVPLP